MDQDDPKDTGGYQPDASGPQKRERKNRERKKAGQNSLLSWLKEIATIVAVAVVLSFLIKTFLFRAFFIPSTSMEETLEVDDRIFVNLLVPQPFELTRGDVVVFQDDLSWLPPNGKHDAGNWFQQFLTFVGLMPDASQQHLVKRVIGLGGDQVVCCDVDGRISVNGEPLDEDPYLAPGSDNTRTPFDVTVPEGKIWVMGDNRNHSADSREHQDEASNGFVAVESVEGKASVIAWPLDRLGFLGNYPEVFDGVPAPSAATGTEPPAITRQNESP
ncbi:MAG: signal peptidase I [Actinomycetota bacterium]